MVQKHDKIDIHLLAIQMGTSVGMLEKHYSHLIPSLSAEQLAGKKFKKKYKQKKKAIISEQPKERVRV